MQSLSRIVDLHARLRPGGEAIVYGEVRRNWSDMQARVHRIAAGLSDEGVGEGTIVAILMKNSAAFVELLYAISHLGAVSLPVNFRLSADEFSYIANHAGTKLVVVDADLEELTATADLPTVVIDVAAQSDLLMRISGTPVESTPAHCNGSDIFRLMYTSGTTSRPKGVIHSYDNFYWKCWDHTIALQLNAEDRLGVVGPLYHVGACDLPGLAVHLNGGTMVILRDFDAQAALQMIEAERITGIWLAPVMTSAMLASEDTSDTSSLRWCIGGGEKTPENWIRTFSSRFENAMYYDAYGMTETVSGDTLMVPGFEIEKIGSVGRPLAFVDIRIRDDEGRDLAAGETGEICIQSPKVTSGYWKDPDNTAAARCEDGYLRSGDMGYLDEEGFLYLTDRKKDMIISGGENIASSEIERVLYEMSEISEVAVVGKPDEKWGEVPIAVVVPVAGQNVTFEMIDQHCRAHLGKFKCPKGLVLCDTLPRNPSGKILKREIRDQLQNMDGHGIRHFSDKVQDFSRVFSRD